MPLSNSFTEQLSRALRLARGNAPLARPAVRPRHRALPPPPAINNPSSPASHLSADQQQLSDQLDEDQDDDRPRAEQIPLWAILISLTLLSMALLAVLMAHWVGRRMSANHQVHHSGLRNQKKLPKNRKDDSMNGVALKFSLFYKSNY